MSTICQPSINDALHRFRVLLLVALLTVGALNVTQCSKGADDAGRAAQDQYDRMYRSALEN